MIPRPRHQKDPANPYDGRSGHEHPNAPSLEFSSRDLDGYYVTMSAFDLALLRK